MTLTAERQVTLDRLKACQYQALENSKVADDFESATWRYAAHAFDEGATLITSMGEEIYQLKNGDRAILPQSIKHAEDLYTVAVAGLKSFDRDPEEHARALSSQLEEAKRLCLHFIAKVDSGRARSTETYNQMKAFLNPDSK